MKVSVFGSAGPRPGEPQYEQAYQLGQRLATLDHTILNGGYIGTMEAVSKGGQEASGHVVGAVCDEIEAWRDVAPNPYLSEIVRFATLKERLLYLVEAADAYLALPGGIGTLAEIAITWNQMQTASIPQRPLIVIGAGWQSTFEAFIAGQEGHVKSPHAALLHYAADIDQAAALLTQLLGD